MVFSSALGVRVSTDQRFGERQGKTGSVGGDLDASRENHRVRRGCVEGGSEGETTYMALPAKMSRCCTGGMPAFSSTRSLTFAI